jgi:2-haloacid dehalogenase
VQLAYAGLTGHFDAILSADTVRALKPRREPYELVARTFGVPIGEVTLVAAHSWDVAGALAAGCRAAFVARPGMPRNPIDPAPHFVGADLGEIADQLLAD